VACRATADIWYGLKDGVAALASAPVFWWLAGLWSGWLLWGPK
jgi:hypothetical protein